MRMIQWHVHQTETLLPGPQPSSCQEDLANGTAHSSREMKIAYLVDSLPMSSLGKGGGGSSSACALVSADFADDGDTELDFRLRPKKDNLCLGLVGLSESEMGGTGGIRRASGCFVSGRLPRRRSEISEVLERKRPAEDLWPDITNQLGCPGVRERREKKECGKNEERRGRTREGKRRKGVSKGADIVLTLHDMGRVLGGQRTPQLTIVLRQKHRKTCPNGRQIQFRPQP